MSGAQQAALPFSVDLPPGFLLIEGRAAPGAHVYSARKAGKTYLMIYTGPSSQFPIYDGEQVTAGGRISVVVPEGARRIAMEHLFQRSAEPAEIHVWVMAQDGADRDEAERIAQTLHLSLRSLQRHLSEEGGSYEQVLADTRRDLAQNHLREDDCSISEVAYLLGFADSSSFSRAFKRWTGQSPSQYRDSLRGER